MHVSINTFKHNAGGDLGEFFGFDFAEAPPYTRPSETGWAGLPTDSSRCRSAYGQVPAALDDGKDFDSFSRYSVNNAVILMHQLSNVFILSFGNHPSQLGESQ
jgi:hypothetical protein